MSYDAKTDQIEKQSLATAKGFETLEDLKRVRFLEALDRGDKSITRWEEKFMEGQLERLKPGIGMNRIWFSPKQREVIDKMRKRYGNL